MKHFKQRLWQNVFPKVQLEFPAGTNWCGEVWITLWEIKMIQEMGILLEYYNDNRA